MGLGEAGPLTVGEAVGVSGPPSASWLTAPLRLVAPSRLVALSRLVGPAGLGGPPTVGEPDCGGEVEDELDCVVDGLVVELPLCVGLPAEVVGVPVGDPPCEPPGVVQLGVGLPDPPAWPGRVAVPPVLFE